MSRLMPEVALEVRPALSADEPAIQHLLARAVRPFNPAWPWREHLGQEVFQVALSRGRIVGALLAWPDAGPVAWVRLAALGTGVGVGPWLDASLPPLLRPLRRLRARLLAWLDVGEWPGLSLRARGFWSRTRVVTMIKDTRWLPPGTVVGVQLRPAEAAEIGTLVRVDRQAFSPPWWLSSATLERLRRESLCFLVAEEGRRCLGYVGARPLEHGAHIDRLAVAPWAQGQGIGGVLLEGVLSRLWELGVERVTLNTQERNRASLRLYARFGFRPVGRRAVMWERGI